MKSLDAYTKKYRFNFNALWHEIWNLDILKAPFHNYKLKVCLCLAFRWEINVNMIILMAHERNITPLGFFFLLFIIIFYFNVIMDKAVDTKHYNGSKLALLSQIKFFPNRYTKLTLQVTQDGKIPLKKWVGAYTHAHSCFNFTTSCFINLVFLPLCTFVFSSAVWNRVVHGSQNKVYAGLDKLMLLIIILRVLLCSLSQYSEAVFWQEASGISAGAVQPNG